MPFIKGSDGVTSPSTKHSNSSIKESKKLTDIQEQTFYEGKKMQRIHVHIMCLKLVKLTELSVWRWPHLVDQSVEIIKKWFLNHFHLRFSNVDVLEAIYKLHERYQVFQSLITRPGFTFDRDNAKVITSDDIWVAALKVR